MEHRVDQLSKSILGAIRQQLGADDENDTSKDDIINTMSNRELLDSWLKWEGIIGYTETIISVINNIWTDVVL